MRRLLVAVLLTLAVVAEARDETRTRVTMNDRDTRLLGHSPLRVRIVARISNPTDEWFCPSVEVTWTGGELHSFRESDCDPLEEQERPLRPFVSEAIVGYLGPGEHRIEVRLRQGKRTRFFTLEATIM